MQREAAPSVAVTLFSGCRLRSASRRGRCVDGACLGICVKPALSLFAALDLGGPRRATPWWATPSLDLSPRGERSGAGPPAVPGVQCSHGRPQGTKRHRSCSPSRPVRAEPKASPCKLGLRAFGVPASQGQLGRSGFRLRRPRAPGTALLARSVTEAPPTQTPPRFWCGAPSADRGLTAGSSWTLC